MALQRMKCLETRVSSAPCILQRLIKIAVWHADWCNKRPDVQGS